MKKAQTHNLHTHLEKRRRLRIKATPEERVMWKLLSAKQLNGTHWYRQFSVGHYILDFYCPAAKLCVEIDGLHHLSEEVAQYDNQRTAYLANEGIEVLRVPNEIVWTQSDVMLSAILEALERRMNIKEQTSSVTP